MASMKGVNWFLFIVFLSHSSGQYLGTNSTLPLGICQSVFCDSTEDLAKLKDCVVVVGNLRIVLFKFTTKESYRGISLPNLREVTGFVVFYRLNALETLGKLLPNLARIRGQEVLHNYALIIHDMNSLKEIGLFNLIKIDRGGVTVWGGPRTCYVKSIDWNSIIPKNSTLSLTSPEIKTHCDLVESYQCANKKMDRSGVTVWGGPRTCYVKSIEWNSLIAKNSTLSLTSPEIKTLCDLVETCQCGNKTSYYCWNNETCQYFFEKDDCHPECLGCLQGNRNKCLVCRNFTHRGKCVSYCPSNTIILPANQYCLTIEECKSIYGWSWNETCVMNCPIGYTKYTDRDHTTCEITKNPSHVKKVCPGMTIHALSGIQMTERCTHINGSLKIRIRSIPDTMEEMSKYLNLIEEVTDYIEIYGSMTITSLEFFSKLHRIRGQTRMNGGYSLIIHDMVNLELLFTPNVTENLIIDRGKLKFYRNPKLCMSKIIEISGKFPDESQETDVPIGMNGYNGGCLESELGFTIKAVSDSTANVYFTKLPRNNVTYTIFYTRLFNENQTLVPECCNNAKWSAVQSNITLKRTREEVVIKELYPATTYVACIEVHIQSDNILQALLTRSYLKNFTTTFTAPKPPFISELVAMSPNAILIKWADHKDYRRHIAYHELDIKLIEIPLKDLKVQNHCDNHIVHPFFAAEKDYSPHFVVRKPPENYLDCGPNCESITSEYEDIFDACDTLDRECNEFEESLLNNSSFRNYVRTLTLKISGPRTELKVEGLAPFRDYRFRLRSCVHNCSRFTRHVVRTLRSKEADVPNLTQYDVNETGHIFIKWVPPDVTNGPVLKYSVQILPLVQTEANNGSSMPQLLCVHFDTLNMTVKYLAAKEFNISVCSTTLGSLLACSDWKTAAIPAISIIGVLASIIFSITLIAFSIFIGYVYRLKKMSNDLVVPLVDVSSTFRIESQPPRAMLTDFMPFYAVPLSESLLEHD